MSPAHLDRLIEFLVDTRLEDVPAEVVEDGRTSFTDTVGCMLGGMTARPVRALAARLARPGAGSAVIGSAVRTSAVHAALLGGVGATWLDLDSGHRPPVADPPVPAIHPPVHLVPALFALLEPATISGRELLRAYLLTYEVTARLGLATVLRVGLHGHGIQPTIGAGLAAAIVGGAGAGALAATFRLAGGLCMMTDMQAALDGGSVRNAYAGVGAAAGVLASGLARRGVAGTADPLGDVFGGVASTRFDEDALLDGLGSRWETPRAYYKVHACCRWNHPTLDALEDLRRSSPVAAGDVVRVEVRTFRFAAGIAGREPRTELGAKFSIPYAVAASLVLGSTGHRSFAEEALGREDVRELARRVTVLEDPASSAAWPERRPSLVSVHLRDGTVRTGAADGSRGDPGRRFPAGAMDAKFLELASAALGEERAAAGLERLRRIDELAEAASLVRALTAAPGPAAGQE